MLLTSARRDDSGILQVASPINCECVNGEFGKCLSRTRTNCSHDCKISFKLGSELRTVSRGWLTCRIQSFLIDASVLRDYYAEFAAYFVYVSPQGVPKAKVATMSGLKKQVLDKADEVDYLTLHLKQAPVLFARFLTCPITFLRRVHAVRPLLIFRISSRLSRRPRGANRRVKTDCYTYTLSSASSAD